ncbi:hypothetical protein FH063_003062 [Azospirillum argentinense]|uniref:Uncharacterized protein n=2 Tax=Azospirillum TaxID=191 RepID=A0A5B0KMU7_9PROT|nr:hypothetical protein FH063_003062 [Azospirillum argentinense]
MRLRSLLEAAPEDTELEPLSSMVLAVEVGSEAYMDALTAVSDALGSELGRAPQ